VWNFANIITENVISTENSAHSQKNKIIIIKIEWNDNGNNKMEVND
jgi:hypothetical protein